MRKRLGGYVAVGVGVTLVLLWLSRLRLDLPEPSMLLRCPEKFLYQPRAAPPDYPLQISASIHISGGSVQVHYSIISNATETYIIYSTLGRKLDNGKSVADPNAVQIDFDGNTLFFKKQYAAFCGVGTTSETIPLLEPEHVALAPGGTFSESFVVPLPAVVNYEPRASSMLASATEGKLAQLRAKIGWPIPPLKATPTASRTARRIGIGVGVAPATLTSIDEQRILFQFFEVNPPIELMAYELRETSKP